MIISNISPSNVFAAQTPKKYVKSLSLSEKSLNLNVGQRGSIFYKVNAKGKVSKKVTAKTSNSNVKVTIQKNKINILARKVGTSKITIYTQGKSIKKQKIKKNIKISITENVDSSGTSSSPAYSPVVTSASSEENKDITSDTKKPSSDTQIDVTKSEWIATIMKLSGYEIHEESFQYNENGDILYSFTDIADDKNAKMIETAVKYGIIPCQGGAFNPSAAADREFLAVTAVRSIGFATNETEINYNDKSDLLYSVEDAIAVQLELLKLSDNKFLPTKAITKEEKQNAENIVSDIMASREIDTKHKDIVEYNEEVKTENNVTDYTISEQNNTYTVNIPAGTSIDKVSEGDKIVLPPADGCSEGIAMTISSTSLSPDGKSRIVTGTIPDDISDFVETVDIEGEAKADIDGITAVDGVATVEVITGENISKNSMKKAISGQVNLKDKTMIKYTVKEIETTVSFYLEELKYNIDFNKKGVNEIYIGLPNVLSFNTDYKANKDFSKKIGDIPVNLQGGFSINLEVYLETSVNGQVTMNLKLANNIGMQYYNGQFYIEKSCEPSFNAAVDADVDIGAKMQLGMYWMKGMMEIFGKEDPRPLYNVSTKWGLHGDATLHIRNDKYTAYEILTCVNLAYYLYGNINVGDGSLLGDKFDLKKTWEIYTKENSPLKGTCHIENMQKTDTCTYKVTDEKNETIDSYDTFYLEGKRITVPISVSELLNLGFKIDISDNALLSPETKSIKTYIYNSKGKRLAKITIVNTGDSDIQIKDGIIDAFIFTTNSDIEFYGDLSFYSTKKQVYDICGEPKFRVYESKDYNYDQHNDPLSLGAWAYRPEEEKYLQSTPTSSYRWCINHWLTKDMKLNSDKGIYEVKHIYYHFLEITFDDNNNISRIIFAFDPMNVEDKNANMPEILPSDDNPSEMQGLDVDTKVKSVSLGKFHSSAITTNGDLYCWGYNSKGAVGNGTKVHQTIPTKVLANVRSISLGCHYSAAITTSRDLYCWGNNSNGQVGNGTTTDQVTPVKVLNNVKSIALGLHHSAAITTSGDLYCWGANSHGQIGNDTRVDQLFPIKILTDVKSISLGDYHSAAITNNGDLYCWGCNSFGEIGNGTTSIQNTPTKVLTNVKSVSLSDDYSAAITTNGDLYCWGRNFYGQVGNGTSVDLHIPTKVLSNVESIDLSTDHSAAITTNGDLYCWGYNLNGQIGNYSTTNQTKPIKILSNIKSVSLGYSHSSAITTNGDLYCWGKKVANGSTTFEDQISPTKILSDVNFISSNCDHSAAITTNGDLYCWGYNTGGMLGNGTVLYHTTPIKVLGVESF